MAFEPERDRSPDQKPTTVVATQINKIDGAARTVRELLDSKKYSIEYYQREFRWEPKHVEALVEDLETRFARDWTSGDPRTAVRDYSHYFLGPIVLSRRGNLHYIIDGQQRLTSLTLLLIHLHHLQQGRDDAVDVTPLIFATQYGQKSFNLDVEERQPIMKALFEGEAYEPPDEHGSVATMLARYRDIETIFPDDLKEDALPYFVDWLLDNVQLVQITAYNDEDAYAIFESMNDRGLRLTPTEMLKGYLLSKIGDETQTAAANELWRKKMVDLEGLGPDEHSDFIKAWLRSQYARKIRERKRGATNQDFDHIGTEFHKWVREEGKHLKLQGAADFEDFIQTRFRRFVDWYLLIRQAEKQLTSGLEHLYYNASNNFTLQPPLLLAPLALDDDDDIVRRKLQLVACYIDIFIFRRVINNRTLGYSSIVYTMFNLMRDMRGLPVGDLAILLEDKVAELDEETPREGILSLRVHQQNRARVHGILARMSRYVEEQADIESSYASYTNRQLSDPYEVEHIWADMPDQHDDEFPDERDFRDYRDRLGGLVLLPRSFNQSYGALPYAEKYPHYVEQNLLVKTLHEQCYQSNPKFLAFKADSNIQFEPHQPPFTKADIDQRQELYSAICDRIWSSAKLAQIADATDIGS